MYRCKLCGAVTKPHEPQKMLTEYRWTDKGEQQIAKQTPVCGPCHEAHKDDK